MNYKKILIMFVVCLQIFSYKAYAVANGGSASGTTPNMSSSDYWLKYSKFDENKLLMDNEAIKDMNRLILDASGVNTFDLVNLKEVYDATALRDRLSKNEIPTRDLFIDGKKIDNTKYFTNINKAISKSGIDKSSAKNIYAVCTNNADIKGIPTNDVIGYSENDPDDEMESSTLLVNEPFVVRQKCKIGDELFYWGYADSVTGWVDAKNLAICSSKNEWLDAWQVEVGEDNFLVVTQDKIILEKSLSTPNTSEIKLLLGTILKLVPDSEMPEKIGERGTWNNYVVYLPIRDTKGNYKKEVALISEHYNVSIGFLPMTQKNLLDVAFSCLGNRYGWGNMLDAMDCSGYVQNVYRCFGVEMPRNTSWQQLIPGTAIDISKLSDAEKTECIKSLPLGTPLYFSGHTMLYIGTDDKGVSYVISATGSLSNRDGELAVKSMYGVIVNPLDARRKNGATWLNNLSKAVVLPNIENVANCDVNLNSKSVVSYANKILTENIDYTVIDKNDHFDIIGKGDFIGVKCVDKPKKFTGFEIASAIYNMKNEDELTESEFNKILDEFSKNNEINYFFN